MSSGNNVQYLGILEGATLIFVCIFTSRTCISFTQRLSRGISIICLI